MGNKCEIVVIFTSIEKCVSIHNIKNAVNVNNKLCWAIIMWSRMRFVWMSCVYIWWNTSKCFLKMILYEPKNTSHITPHITHPRICVRNQLAYTCWYFVQTTTNKKKQTGPYAAGSLSYGMRCPSKFPLFNAKQRRKGKHINALQMIHIICDFRPNKGERRA